MRNPSYAAIALEWLDSAVEIPTDAKVLVVRRDERRRCWRIS
jgi:hypothetical protein